MCISARTLGYSMKTLEMAAPFLGILLDAYGVFWGGGTGVIPGSQAVMQELVAAGKIVGILSNTSQSADREKTKFAKYGLIQGIHYHFILTSGELTRQLFLHSTPPFASLRKRYWVLGTPHPHFSSSELLLQETGYSRADSLDQADFIHLEIPHRNGEDQTDPELFREEVLRLIPSGLPMLCINPDTFAHEGIPPRPVVRQGTLARFYEKAGGEVIYIGKPSLLAFDAAFRLFQAIVPLQPHEILMIGDTPETDIRGAKYFGMRSALITEIGIFSERKLPVDQLPLSDQPDFTLESFPHDLHASPQF